MSGYHQVLLEILEGPASWFFKVSWTQSMFVTAQPVTVGSGRPPKRPPVRACQSHGGMQSLGWRAAIRPTAWGTQAAWMDPKTQPGVAKEQQQTPENYTQHVNVIDVLNKT